MRISCQVGMAVSFGLLWVGPVRGQVDTLRDAKGRVAAYTDGYSVYEAGDRVVAGIRGVQKPGLRGMLLPVEGSSKRFHVLQVDSLGRVVSARVWDASRSTLVASSLKPEQFERVGVGAGEKILLTQQGITQAYDLSKPGAGPKELSAKAAERFRRLSQRSLHVPLENGLAKRLDTALPSQGSGKELISGEVGSRALDAGAIAAAPVGAVSGPSNGLATAASPLGTSSMARTHPAAVWQFGYGGQLLFGEEGVRAEGESKLAQHEGSASYSNEKGELVSYSDGSMLYGSRGEKVEPRRVSALGGHVSATQSALFVPVPGSRTRVLLFSQDQGGYAGPGQGLHYSEVSQQEANKQTQVEDQREKLRLEAQTVEKLSGVHHANGRDIWVLTHRSFSQDYVAYLVTEAGVGQAVVSTAGGYHSGFDNGSIGQMKISPDGRWVAAAVTGANRVDLLRFDTRSGRVTEGKSLHTEQNPNSIYAPYGVEFSPTGDFLFVTAMLENAVWRFDLRAADPSHGVVKRSGTRAGLTCASLQLGPDGQVYVAMIDGPAGVGSRWVGRIEAPDGEATFVDTAVALPEGQRCRMGLPNFVASFFAPAKLDFEAAPRCTGIPTEFANWSRPKGRGNQKSDWWWDFGDPNTDADTSSAESPRYTYALPGVYTVRLKSWRGGQYDTLSRRVEIGSNPELDLGPDQTLPPDGSALRLQLTDSPSIAYVWDDGSTKPRREISSAGLYWVRAISGACQASDSIRILPRASSVLSQHNPNESNAQIEPTMTGSASEQASSPPASESVQRWLNPTRSMGGSGLWGEFHPMLSLLPVLHPAGYRGTMGVNWMEQTRLYSGYFSPFSTVQFQPQVGILWLPGRRSTK